MLRSMLKVPVPVLRNRAILPRFRFRVPIFFPTVQAPVPVQVPVPTLKFFYNTNSCGLP